MIKLKNKVFVLTILLMLVGTMSAGALVYHVNDAADNLKSEYREEIEIYKSEKDLKIKNETSDLTQREIERMKTETEQYLRERLGHDYQTSLNDKTDEIIRVTDEKIEEIKRYIDELINAK